MKFAIGVGGLLFCWGQVCLAQTATTRHVDISLNSSSVYEGNVLRLPAGAPDPVGFSRSDFRLAPAVNLDIVQPFGRQTLTLIGGLGYDFYRKNKLLERERINLQGTLDLAVGPDCAPKLGILYSRQQSDLADFFAFTTARLRNAEQQVSYTAAVKCGSVIGLKPELTFEHTNVKNSSIFRQVGNYRSTTFGASLGYISPVIGEVSLFANYKRGGYPNRGLFAGTNVSDNIKVYSGGLRYRRDLGTRLKGNISAGFTIVEPTLSNVKRFSGASGSADLTVQLLDRLQVLIGFSRQVEQSNQLDISYSVNDSYNVSANYIAGPTLQFNAGADRTRRSLKDSPLLNPNRLGANDRFTQFFAGVRYRPPGPIGFSLNLSKTSRRSDIQLFNYKASSAALGVSVNF